MTEYFTPDKRLYGYERISSPYAITANTTISDPSSYGFVNTTATNNFLISLSGIMAPPTWCIVSQTHATYTLGFIGAAGSSLIMPDGTVVPYASGGVYTTSQTSTFKVTAWTSTLYFVEVLAGAVLCNGVTYYRGDDARGKTGTGSRVLATSPTLTTPILGAATATSINKVTVTQPANGSTLTISDGKTLAATASVTLGGTDGKTLSVSNNLTLVGTDGTTHTFPARSATLEYRGNRQKLTSASDTTVTLTTANADEIVVTGTGVMYVLDLGDATTYTSVDGDVKKYKIINATNEFLGVKNSTGTTWHRVPPRCVCECYLTDGSTAAGVWSSHVYYRVDPRYGFNETDDFMSSLSSNNLFGKLGWTGVASGTGASVDISQALPLGSQGGIRLNSGTTSSSYAQIYVGGGGVSYLGSAARAFEWQGGLSVLSTASDEYIVRVGIGQNITGGAHTSGVYFLYDRYNGGGTAQPNWMLKNINGSGNQTVDSGVAVTYGANLTAIQNLRCEIDSGLTRSDWFINHAQVSPSGGLANYLPATSTAIKQMAVGITRSAYASVTCTLQGDWVWLQSFPSTLR